MTPVRYFSKLTQYLAMVLMVILLTGCQKDLFTAMAEADANEVLAVLLSSHIDAEKASTDNGKTWNIRVPDDRIVQSLELLRARGLPRGHYANLGDMFKKDGLISTPIEERIRFVYGVSQELADTLNKMDGVIVARVHIVLPNNDPLASDLKPSSASVFIKHRPDLATVPITAPIKNLVAHSVEGLTYDQVSVIFVAADPSLLTIATPPTPTVVSTLGIALALLILALGVVAYGLFLRPEGPVGRRLPGVLKQHVHRRGVQPDSNAAALAPITPTATILSETSTQVAMSKVTASRAAGAST